MRSDETQSHVNVSKLQFEVGVDNHETLSPILYGHNTVTALVSNHVCHNSILRQKIFVNA